MGRILLVGSTVSASWLAMMLTHEAGHVLHAWLSGGTVVRVTLHPLHFSYTQLAANPHPHFVAWGGALWGCLLPLGFWIASKLAKARFVFVLRFFAGFCLIANGAYLGVGAFIRVADAEDLLRYGSPAWLLVAFGGVTLPTGLYLWHGLGPHFGFGKRRGAVDSRVTLGVAIVALALVCSMFLFG